MTPNRDMIDAFVDGRLSAADHELMVHHISSCTECAAAVIAALAEAARALAAEVPDRSSNAASRNGSQAVVAESGGDDDASPPATADLLQLDFVLDKSSDAPELLLKREEVQEIPIDELAPRAPSAPGAIHVAHSLEQAAVHLSEAAVHVSETAVTTVVEVEPVEVRSSAAEIADVLAEETVVPDSAGLAPAATAAEESDVDHEPELIATATAAGVAGSAALGAAALAEHAEQYVEDAAALEAATAAEDPTAQAVVNVEEEQPEVASALPDPIGNFEAPLTETLVGAAVASEEPVAPVALNERVPDETRAAIVESLRGDSADVAPRRRSTGILSVFAALAMFLAVGAYAALQLRAFASPADQELLAVAPAAPSAEVTPLAAVLDSAVFAQVIDVPDSAVAPDTTAALAEPAASARPVRRAVVAQPRAAAPVPVTGSASPVPRLLRTTTHPRGDVVLVLREYDAAAPAPGARPGVNEYRWTNESLTRLFVLTGPVEVAELRAFARTLEPRTP